MKILDYLLSKPDYFTYEILYIFEGYCSKCGRLIQNEDDEYSVVQTVGSLRHDVDSGDKLSHYYDYDFIYNDFDTSDSNVTVEGYNGKFTIVIVVFDSDGCQMCDTCLSSFAYDF